MIRPKMFRARISNCTDLFRPEPNQTRHRIFAFVRLIFGDLQKPKCCTYTLTIRRHYVCHIHQTLELTMISISCLHFLQHNFLSTAWSDSGTKKVPRPDRSDVGPARNSTSTCSATMTNSHTDTITDHQYQASLISNKLHIYFTRINL